MRLAKLYSILLWLLFSYCCLMSRNAAASKLEFHRLPIDQTLSQNSISCMLQDRRGLMWFGTYGGLNVYDGYRFRQISSDPRDSNGLAGTDISRLLEDQQGGIWVAGSLGGSGWLDRLDTTSGLIRHFPADLFGESNRPGSGWTGLHQSADGIVWIGTNSGLHRYHPDTGIIDRNVDARADRAPLPGITDIVSNRDGRLWLATPLGLHLYDPVSGQLQSWRHDAADPHSLSDDFVSRVLVARDGSVWAASLSGLNHMANPGEGFTRFQHNSGDANSLGGDYVRDLLEDNLGQIWVAAYSGGLSRYNNDQFDVFYNDPDDARSLSSDNLWSLYQDRSGLIWIGTADAGLNQINASTNRFQSLSSIPFNSDSLRSPFVWDLQQDKAGVLWMSTLAGLESYDANAPAHHHFHLYEPAHEDKVVNQLQSLLIDRDGSFWVGAVDGHLYRFSPLTGQFSRITRQHDPRQAFSNDSIYYLTQTGDGRIWVGSAEGLFALDPVQAKVVDQILPSASIPMGITAIRSSLTDADGQIWFGGGGAGLIRYQAGKGVTAILGHEPDHPGSLSNNVVRALYEARDGTLYVGTLNGLNVMSTADRKAARNHFRLYTVADGLANNTVYGIVPQADGRYIWLSSNAGLSRFDTQTSLIRNFTVQDGLSANEMNGGAELLAADGNLYFGTVNGLSWFHPDQLSFNDYVPTVTITSIDRHRLAASGAVDLRLISGTERLDFAYNNMALTIDFAAMDFHQPYKNRFRYRLTSASGGDWVNTDRPSVSFAMLPPADYRFEVMASNNDGVWSTHMAGLTIHVSPPWWLSTSAYAVYALILALLGFLVLRWRRNRWEMKAARISAEQAKQAKSDFLATITHELRTPLNGIIGATQLLQLTTLNAEQKECADSANEAAHDLLRQIDDMLDYSTLENHAVHLKDEVYDLPLLLQDVVRSHGKRAQEKALSLDVVLAENLPQYWRGDSLRLRQVMVQLVGNAIKFTLQGHVVVDVFTSSKELHIVVTDTGIGMGRNTLKGLFKSFQQGETGWSRRYAGTGLGLALCTELIGLMGGRLKVTSTLNKGSQFTVLLPLSLTVPDTQAHKEMQVRHGLHSIARVDQAAQKLPAIPDQGHGGVYDKTVIAHASDLNASRQSDESLAQFLRSGIRLRVLLVEDNLLNQRIEQRMLEKLGCHVDVASDGLVALELLAVDRHYDCVFMDCQMPGMDGFEVTRRLRALQMKLPVIAVTANTQIGDRQRCLDAGMDDYLAKPVGMTAFQSVLQRIAHARAVALPPDSPYLFSNSKRYDN